VAIRNGVRPYSVKSMVTIGVNSNIRLVLKDGIMNHQATPKLTLRFGWHDMALMLRWCYWSMLINIKFNLKLRF
jgi:hypothetical protein